MTATKTFQLEIRAYPKSPPGVRSTRMLFFQRKNITDLNIHLDAIRTVDASHRVYSLPRGYSQLLNHNPTQ